jgi:hypothetical protein
VPPAAHPAATQAVLPPGISATPDSLALAVGNYRRHGASGTIDLVRARDGRLLVTHSYEVRPEGAGWRVVEPYR